MILRSTAFFLFKKLQALKGSVCLPRSLQWELTCLKDTGRIFHGPLPLCPRVLGITEIRVPSLPPRGQRKAGGKGQGLYIHINPHPGEKPSGPGIQPTRDSETRFHHQLLSNQQGSKYRSRLVYQDTKSRQAWSTCLLGVEWELKKIPKSDH